MSRKLISPVFSLPSSDHSGPVTIRAESAELRSNPGSGKLTILLYSGVADGPGFHAEHPDHEWEHEVDINSDAVGADSSPAHLALAQIPANVVRQHESIDALEQRMVAETGFRVLRGDFDGLAGNGWAADVDNLQFQKFRLYRMQTELPRRWANGFSCLCFALVGSAMAIRRKNADMLTSFFLCFGPILLVYYPFLFFGVDRAKAGAISPYAVWLANAVLIAWGLWLLRRVIRY
jgi:lipopolysaccharide export system permease protein